MNKVEVTMHSSHLGPQALGLRPLGLHILCKVVGSGGGLSGLALRLISLDGHCQKAFLSCRTSSSSGATFLRTATTSSFSSACNEVRSTSSALFWANYSFERYSKPC